jgi:hypothetical protein
MYADKRYERFSQMSMLVDSIVIAKHPVKDRAAMLSTPQRSARVFVEVGTNVSLFYCERRELRSEVSGWV